MVDQDHLHVKGKTIWGPRLSSSSLTPQSSPWLGDGAPAPGAVHRTGFYSWVLFFWLPPHVHLQPPSALETLQSWQLRVVHTGQGRVSGTDVSLGLSLAVTHLVRLERRAQGNSPQPKYRVGFPGALMRCGAEKPLGWQGTCLETAQGNTGRSQASGHGGFCSS